MLYFVILGCIGDLSLYNRVVYDYTRVCKCKIMGLCRGIVESYQAYIGAYKVR